MKTRKNAAKMRGGLLLALAAGAYALAGGAHAAGTTAGTTISNKATLNYSVGAVGQPAIASSPTGSLDGTGANTDFVVDNKISHTVTTTNGTAVSAIPAQTSVVLNFNVTNTGNFAQGYLLSVANVATGDTVLGGADSNDLTTGTCVIDVNATGATNISTLAVDATVPVTVACTIPGAAANNDRIALTLVARATDSGTTTPVVATVGAGTLAGVDVVFADTAGPDTVIDADRDGRASGRSAYLVQTAALLVTKVVAVRCDPLNGAVSPKSIPGAYMRYTVTIANGGTAGASALLTTMADTLNANVDFDPNLIQGTGAASTCDATAGVPSGAANSGVQVIQTNRGVNAFLTNTGGDADGLAVAGSPATLSFNFAQALPAGGAYQAGELKAGETLTLVYQVKIK